MRSPTARRTRLGEPPLRALLAATALLVGLACVLAPARADAQRRRRRRNPSATPAAAPRRPSRAPARPARRPARGPARGTAATTSTAATAPVLDTERPPVLTSSTSPGVDATATNGQASGPPPPPPPAASTTAAVRPAAIDVQVGGRIFGRHLSYSGDARASFMAYDLDVGPAIAGAAEWYPGAHFSAGPAAWFGLIGTAEFAVGLSTRDPQGRAFGTTAYALAGGLRFRVPIARHDLGLFAMYGAQVYALGGDGGSSSGVPSVAYQYIRVGGSFRIALGDRVAILVQAAYLGVLAAGEITSAMYFPRSANGGLDVGLGLAVRVIAGFELRLTFDYRRYFFGFNPMSTETFPSGGAADEYLGATLSAAYRF